MIKVIILASLAIASSFLLIPFNEIIVDNIKINNIHGTSQVTDSILIEQFTMDFNNYFNYNTQVLSSAENYSMIISGNYRIASISNGLDAAYYYCYYGCPNSCDFNTPCNVVQTDDRITNTLRPDNDVYNDSHEYYYSFTGTDTPMAFEFIDGNYGDNGGSLDISIYQSTPHNYYTANNSSLYINNNSNGLILKSDNNSCYKIHVDNTGTLVTSITVCPN